MKTLGGLAMLGFMIKPIYALYDVHLAPGAGRWGMVRTIARAGAVLLLVLWVALALWTIASLNPTTYQGP